MANSKKKINYGNPSIFMQQCLQPLGYILDDTDCDDDDANIYPGGPPVRIIGTPLIYYPTLQMAYDVAQNLDTLQSKAVSLAEDLNINSDISAVFQGGYDCSYSVITGLTTINGNVVIISGRNTVKDFSIEASGGVRGSMSFPSSLGSLKVDFIPSDPLVSSHPTSTPEFIQ